jgi:transcription antitermination factor NusG
MIAAYEQGTALSARRAERLWFAVVVKPRHEKSTARLLRGRGLEEFLPLYRERRAWSDRRQALELPLFPGYVFCRFSYVDRLRVLSAPGVVCVLGAGDVFSPITEAEIRTIRGIVASGLPARPCPYLLPGEVVRVMEGPLAGVSGTVLRHKGITSVVITVETLRRSLAVELDSEAVRSLITPSLAVRGCTTAPVL